MMEMIASTNQKGSNSDDSFSHVFAENMIVDHQKFVQKNIQKVHRIFQVYYRVLL